MHDASSLVHQNAPGAAVFGPALVLIYEPFPVAGNAQPTENLKVIYLTRPEDRLILDVFYRRVRWGGAGWQGVAARTGVGEEGMDGTRSTGPQRVPDQAVP